MSLLYIPQGKEPISECSRRAINHNAVCITQVSSVEELEQKEVEKMQKQIEVEQKIEKE